MIAQKLVEGQTYVTISLVPYIVYKIRKCLLEVIQSEVSAIYIRSIATEMVHVFNEHFGQGLAGTVATEKIVEGERRRPKGIHMLALMASILDPRMKRGIGISEEDQTQIYDNIRQSIVEIGHEELQQHHQGEHRDLLQHNPQQDQVIAVPPSAHDLEIFDELDVQYMLENANRHENNDAAVEEDLTLMNTIDAEITLYKQKPSIRLKNSQNIWELW